ncbi:AAA family ATPase [Corynebacterium striatum]|uniref:AAA family ATPase n=1 Tax=Corynebacterium striatum TaxID=43770 RepID=UPI0006276F72|nr:AAA family ATPase [Corynebacterium striatum]KKO79592.1 ABC transporter [Corynebacterium striatum]MDK7885028.1 AAA family ATPase [Corynebacterium striatum]
MLLQSISISEPPFEDYLLDLPSVQYLIDLPYFEFTAPVTCLVGENGAGKSTLLEAIAVALRFSPLGGRYDDPDRERAPLRGLARVLKCSLNGNLHRGFFLRAETHESVLKAANQPKERGGRSHLPFDVDLLSRSHGESVFDVLGEYVDGRGLYILDEPEAGLSVIRQMALIAEIHQAALRGAQFIIATHSPILLAAPGANIVELGESGFEKIPFDQAEPVVATRELLDAPEETINFLIN